MSGGASVRRQALPLAPTLFPLKRGDGDPRDPGRGFNLVKALQRIFRASVALTPAGDVMPADAGIQIQPLRRKLLSGGFRTPAFARVTRERRGDG
jgi:hypothetical protein